MDHFRRTKTLPASPPHPRTLRGGETSETAPRKFPNSSNLSSRFTSANRRLRPDLSASPNSLALSFDLSAPRSDGSAVEVPSRHGERSRREPELLRPRPAAAAVPGAPSAVRAAAAAVAALSVL
jgi:hypothetical protein